jgi:hypothetical protein
MPRPTRSGLKVLAVGLLVLAPVAPVLYVVSAGPAWRLVCQGEIERDTWRSVYAPVRRMALGGSPIGRPLFRWIMLWHTNDAPLWNDFL